MAELVRFTGSNAALFCRQNADNLRVGAQVIVPETHTVLLIKDGVVSEALAPGRHDIFDTESGLFRQKKDSSVMSVEFVYISKSAKQHILWGTAAPIITRDPVTDVAIAFGINGELEFKVKSPKKFYLELVGAEKEYSIDKLKKRIMGRLISTVGSEAVAIMNAAGMSYAEFDENKVKIAAEIEKKLAAMFDSEYGLDLCSFSIVSAIISDADRSAVEKKRGEKKCDICGASVPANAKFCPECGATTEIICSCGATLSPSARFCPECGKKIK